MIDHPYTTPTVHRHADGFLEIEWHDEGNSPVLISRELFTEMVIRFNETRERTAS